MAVTFSDLHTEEGLKSLDQFLSNKTYISGDALTKDDIKVYAAVVAKPGDSYPNACRWYESVSSQLASSFPGQAVGVRVGGEGAPVEEPKKDAPVEEDEDDLDLFGDETEEDKKAAEEREAAKKASTKKKESGKSSILMDVKPWDDETDMKKLEEAVRSVEMPGLLWGASKLVPVGYGIKKLQIMLTIVDDLVSPDNIIEDYLTAEPANEYIQSCDIVAFNKI
ncbi:elongation factor 1-beta 2 [Humulus lupulus]|uniref:elongation factor 1-beta 2 n=1 Tax=Humulus lupulus TaxID=3486 RepID=UPI002B4017EE|nr:elongation factor 1-beta 2 [Humulus lupulus]